jgi:tryptophan synthase alpha chain
MTGRYKTMFDRLRGQEEAAFGAFVMLGDPDPRASAEILDRLVVAGVDMLEVGIPFSDPVADGPTIQAAAERALRGGVTPPICFRLLAEFRARHPHVPVGILTYANIVLAPGKDAFYAAAAEAGVDSVLVADVPVLEAAPFIAAANEAGVAPVLIAAPNTPRSTVERIASWGRGYTYCVARSGVTGAERAMEPCHSSLFAALAEFGAPPPVLGFGISTPEQVGTAVETGAAGVICGSALVKLIEHGRLHDLSAMVREMQKMTAPRV